MFEHFSRPVPTAIRSLGISEHTPQGQPGLAWEEQGPPSTLSHTTEKQETSPTGHNPVLGMRRLRPRAGGHFAQVTQVVTRRTSPSTRLPSPQLWDQTLRLLGLRDKEGRQGLLEKESAGSCSSEGCGEAGGLLGGQDSPLGSGVDPPVSCFHPSCPAAPGREQTLGLLSEQPASLSLWPPSPSLSPPILSLNFSIAPSLSPTSFL